MRFPVNVLRVLATVATIVVTVPVHAQGLAYLYVQTTTEVFEFLNDITKRRVLLSDPVEIDAVEHGSAGAGWRRSGLKLAVAKRSYGLGEMDVCRFYAPDVHSHFFTLDPVECSLLKRPGTGWIYEGISFSAVTPVDGSCIVFKDDFGVFPSLVPIYRLYNNRSQFGDTTHRYTADTTVRQALVGAGWINEGVVFCARAAGYENPVYRVQSQNVVAREECENESLNIGACVGLNHTVSMPYRIPSLGSRFIPPTSRANYFTGVEGDLVTSVNSSDIADVTGHSFVVVAPMFSSRPGGADYGIYLNSRDRTGTSSFPAMSINPMYQFVTLPPGKNEVDKRVMPWRDGNVRNLEISFSFYIAYLRRADEGSHAISLPKLALIDTRSRRGLYITLAAGQTVPLPTSEAEDYFARDVDTGKVIVSTSFRANPSFGERMSGESFYCRADATSNDCNQIGGDNFAFRLRPSDIAFVIAKARKLDPALSPNIADYAIDNFSFNNEILNNAELGLSLSSYQLAIIERQY